MLDAFWWLRVLGLDVQNNSKFGKIWNFLILFSLLYSCVLVTLAWQNDFDIAVEIMDVLLPFFEVKINQ